MANTEVLPPLAGVDEVSAYLGVPVQTLYVWRRVGKGPRAAKIGRRLRWRWADVDAWVQANTSQEPQRDHAA